MNSAVADSLRSVDFAEEASAVLNDRFEIWTDQPLPQLASSCTEALLAGDRLSRGRSVMAILPDPSLAPRLDVMEKLRGVPLPGLVHLLDWGIVEWPAPAAARPARSLVLAFDRPAGLPLLSQIDPEYPEMDESDLIRRVIDPAVQILGVFQHLRLTHRAIHPTNLLSTMEDGGVVQLGECVSAPPGFRQPAAYEPIEQMMAHPAARSAGTIADDIYALGVTALALYQGEDPARGRDAESLVAEKMERGSFAALAGKDRLPAGLRELLRGMLQDRPARRWTLDDLDAWLQDRRRKLTTPMPAEAAQRPLLLGGRAYVEPRHLAADMAREWDRVELKDGGHEILKWARHSLADDLVAEHVLTAMELSRNDRQSGGHGGALVARLCAALDPSGPLRYKGLGMHVDGIGSLLAAEFENADIRQLVGEALCKGLPGFQLRLVRHGDGTAPAAARYLGRLGKYAARQEMGYGLERVLYELNPLQACRSPLLADQGVVRLRDLLPALESVASQQRGKRPADRHVMAFIAARLDGNLQPLLEAAEDTRHADRAVLGMLGLLASVQAQTGRHAYPRLARWMKPALMSVAETFRHRIWREKVEHDLPPLIDSGDLTAIYNYLADGEARRRDNAGFAQAVIEFDRNQREMANLRSSGISDPQRTREYGHQLAAGLAGVIGIVSGVVAFVYLV